MTVPPASNVRWKEAITGMVKFKPDFLAAKIFMAGAKVEFQRNPGKIEDLCFQLCQIYMKNASLPTVQRDLTVLFGE
jgi:hypothetical protein